MTTTVILSLIVNIILIMLVVFKSALNDILKELWTDWRERKKEKQQRFNNLMGQSLKLEINLPLSLSYLYLITKLPDVMKHEEMKNIYMRMVEESNKSREYIRNNLVYFPLEIQNSWKELEVKEFQYMDDIAKEKMSYKQLELIIDDIQLHVKKLIAMVNNYIR